LALPHLETSIEFLNAKIVANRLFTNSRKHPTRPPQTKSTDNEKLNQKKKRIVPTKISPADDKFHAFLS
jgi:hypothetical protein